MNTPSHFIITAAGSRRWRPTGMSRSALLLGSVMPDIPLSLLAVGGSVYYHNLLGWTTDKASHYMFDTLYFSNPWWLGSYNLLHAPLILISAFALLWPYRQHVGSALGWLSWFVVGCLFHTAMDIPVHTNDGPLLFFPFEWTLRFHSPVSYWDPSHYGRIFSIFELTLDLVLLVYLGVPPLRRRFGLNRSTRGKTP